MRRIDLSPSISSPFGITIVLLTPLLMLAIITTAIIVVVFRENIVIKSARYHLVSVSLHVHCHNSQPRSLDFRSLSFTFFRLPSFSPLFCILELFGLAVTLSWIYLRVDQPSNASCRMGLLLVVVGLSINLSALVVKNYRIYRIFNSVSVINHAVSNRYLLRVVTIPVVITIVSRPFCFVFIHLGFARNLLQKRTVSDFFISHSPIQTIIVDPMSGQMLLQVPGAHNNPDERQRVLGHLRVPGLIDFLGHCCGSHAYFHQHLWDILGFQDPECHTALERSSIYCHHHLVSPIPLEWRPEDNQIKR